MKHAIAAILTALLLAPLAVLHAGRTLREIPSFGKLRCENFQSLKNCGAITSNDCN